MGGKANWNRLKAIPWTIYCLVDPITLEICYVGEIQ